MDTISLARQNSFAVEQSISERTSVACPSTAVTATKKFFLWTFTRTKKRLFITKPNAPGGGLTTPKLSATMAK